MTKQTGSAAENISKWVQDNQHLKDKISMEDLWAIFDNIALNSTPEAYDELEEPREAAEKVRSRSQTIPCYCGASCCSGLKQNPKWWAAISYLVDYVKSESKVDINYNLRVALVKKYFGTKTSLLEIAGICGINKNTVSKYNVIVTKILESIDCA